jgi:ABC-2 type transport system permease protein
VVNIRAFQVNRTRWIGLKTLICRECGVIIRFWSVTLAPPAITTVLYFTIFGEIIGKRIGSLDGVDYIQYMAPGLIVLWVIPYSYGHTAAGFLGARFFKFIEELLVSPLPDWVVMMGYVMGGMIRGFLVGMAAVVTTLLFTHLRVHSVFVSVAALLLAALVSALGGLITALFAKSFDQVTMIQTSIITPLAYIGGVFNSVSTLPIWAQKLSLANPMFYMVNAFRYGFLGISDVPVGIAFSIMSASGFVLFLAAVTLMARGSGIRD